MTSHRAPLPERMTRAARREQVLDLAQDLFARQGFHHVAMDDIAGSADVSKPVLYRHFPGKLDLYLAVVDRLGADLLAALDARLDGRDLSFEFTEALVLAYLEFVESSGEAFVLILESDVTHDPEVRQRVEQASAEVGRRVRDLVARASGLPDAEADLVAATLIGAAGALAVTRYRSAEVDLERAATLGTALLAGALGALPPRTT